GGRSRPCRPVIHDGPDPGDAHPAHAHDLRRHRRLGCPNFRRRHRVTDAEPAKERTLHLIGNSHIDAVWLWPWEEGFAEVKATFASALERMKEYPEFIFTCSSAAYYAWVEANAPDMFAEIRERVAEGRWQITGG